MTDETTPETPANPVIRPEAVIPEITPTPPVMPEEVKETFLQKVEKDAEEAYHWLVAEIHKIYAKI